MASHEVKSTLGLDRTSKSTRREQIEESLIGLRELAFISGEANKRPKHVLKPEVEARIFRNYTERNLSDIDSSAIAINRVEEIKLATRSASEKTAGLIVKHKDKLLERLGKIKRLEDCLATLQANGVAGNNLVKVLEDAIEKPAKTAIPFSIPDKRKHKTS